MPDAPPVTIARLPLRSTPSTTSSAVVSKPKLSSVRSRPWRPARATARWSHCSQFSIRCAYSARIMSSVPVPKKVRSGGSSASTSSRIAGPVACGSPGSPQLVAVGGARRAVVADLLVLGHRVRDDRGRAAPVGRVARRLDERDLDAEPGDLGRQRLAEALEAPLRRVVEPDARERVHAADRGHLDDVARALLAQDRQRRLRDPQRRRTGWSRSVARACSSVTSSIVPNRP